MLARRAGVVTALMASTALLAVLAPTPALAAGKSRVLRGSVPMRGMNVVLYGATPGGGKPAVLGRTRSARGGAFTLRYGPSGARTVKYLLATHPGGGAEAGFPVPGNSYRLAAVARRRPGAAQGDGQRAHDGGDGLRDGAVHRRRPRRRQEPRPA